MSLTGGVDAGRPVPWPRWVRDNVAVALAIFVRAPRVHARPPWRSHMAVGAVAMVVATAVAMFFADARVATFATAAPRWLVETFAVLTDCGKSSWFLVPTLALLAAIALVASPALSHMSRLVLAAVAVRVGFLFVAIAAPSLFVTVIKRLIGRARPFVGGHPDPFLFHPFVWRADYASLPSGHATTAFAAAIAVGLLWPRLRAPMLVYALVIAVTRVGLDAHYISDVLAGAVVGGIGALLVRDWFAARGLAFTSAGEALPGPSWARVKRVAHGLVAP